MRWIWAIFVCAACVVPAYLQAADDHPNSTPPSDSSSDLQARIEALTHERDNLKAELAQRTRDLAEAETHGGQPAAATPSAPSVSMTDSPALSTAALAQENATLRQENTTLKAELAIIQASSVPYSPEELAVLNTAGAESPAQGAMAGVSTLPGTAIEPSGAPLDQTNASTGGPPSGPTNAPGRKLIVHSSKDLPPGTGPLMADAMQAELERDFKGAEAKYNQILSEDENNVYVLAHLASAQYELGDLAACEKTVQRSLRLDPNDPASLYLLGVLRYRQDKLDDALSALSRSAAANPTNAWTENYLGVVLADKGQPAAAETAFRKAIELKPDHADAHYNLAFVYATEKPPSLALARWHYKRALDLGHPPSPQLEKLLKGEK